MTAITKTIEMNAAKTAENADGSDFAFGNIASDHGATRKYFTYKGKPVLPVTGEFHFSRCRRDKWETELRKIKGQGLDGVAVYVFWNHHETRRGKFDFSGDRDIKEFLRLCRSLSLIVVLRIGPWCHGEVRFGGFPDYVALMPGTRKNSAPYLRCVKRYWSRLYEQVAEFCDGKTVVGIQLENEYTGSIDHIAKLRSIAEEVGFKTPFFTMTAWPTDTPDKRFLPMFGGYPEAPWTQNKRPLPPAKRFAFMPERGEAEIGEDLIGERKRGADFTAFPYATCETGTGNQVTNHRRPVISDMDGYGVAFAHFASGVNWLGYYMYHGGRNPSDRPLQESRRTFYPNNYPVADYDFQAPISKDGDIRRHGDRLRLLHYFIKSDESFLAQSDVYFAREREKPYVSVRTDGKRGYVFFSNYERGERSSACTVRPRFVSDGETPTLPPAEVKKDAAFFHSFGCEYGGETFDYVSAQPITKTAEKDGDTYWFVKTGKGAVTLVKNGKTEYADSEYSARTGKLRFLEEGEAMRFYTAKNAAVFSDGPVFEKDGAVFAELKEGGKAASRLGSAEMPVSDVRGEVVLSESARKRLPYASYMFSAGRRKYYALRIDPTLCGDGDAEIILGFGGLNLQTFSNGKLVDDLFNTDGKYVFRAGWTGMSAGGVLDIRVCAPTKRGSGNVYNEIGLKPGNTSLELFGVRRIRILPLK